MQATVTMKPHEQMFREDHIHHDPKWYIVPAHSTPICLACAVIFWEDVDDLTLRKKFLLSLTLEVLKSGNTLAQVLHSEQEVLNRTIRILLDLTLSADQLVASQAAECVLHLLCQLKNDTLQFGVLDTLSRMIKDDCNYQRCVVPLNLIGRLFYTFPHLVHRLLGEHQGAGSILHFFIAGLSHSSDDVKRSIMFIFHEVYQQFPPICMEIYFQSVHIPVIKNIISILKSGQNKELLKITLSLLRIMMQKEQLASFLLCTSSEGQTLPLALRKLLVSAEDSVLQIAVTQTINATITRHCKAENYAKIWIENDIPAFIFEALSTSNELLFESLLCTLASFMDYECFFTKCYAIYGFESVLQATEKCLEIKCWKMAVLCFQLLSAIFDKNQPQALHMTDAVFQRVLEILKISTQSSDPKVASASIVCSAYFLRSSNLPCPIPLTQIIPLMVSAVASTRKWMKSNINVLLKSKNIRKHVAATTKRKNDSEDLFTEGGLLLTEAIFNLIIEYRTNPIAREQSFYASDSITGVVDQSLVDPPQLKEVLLSCIKAIDEVFIPYLMLCWNENTKLYEICMLLFQDLQLIFNPKLSVDSTILDRFSFILLTTNFLSFWWKARNLNADISSKHFRNLGSLANKFLATFLAYQIKQSNKNEMERLMEKGIMIFGDSPEMTCLVLMQRPQDADDDIHAAHIAFLALCYNSFINEIHIVSVDALVPSLISFLNYGTNIKLLPAFSLRHFTFLMAVATVKHHTDNVTESLNQANKQLLEYLSEHSDLTSLYTRHAIFLEWSCWSKCHVKIWGNFVMNDWLSQCYLSFESDAHGTILLSTFSEAFLAVIGKNILAMEQLLLCLSSQEPITAKKITAFLKKLFEMPQMENVRKIKCFIHHYLPSILMKLFIHGKDEVETIPVLLDLLSWIRNSNSLGLGSEDGKLLFQVCTYLSRFSANHESTILILKYLHTMLEMSKNTGDSRATSIILANSNVLDILEEIINRHENHDLTAHVVLFLASLIQCQLHHNSKSSKKIGIPVRQLCQWLNSTRLESSSISICSAALRFPNQVMVYLKSSHNHDDSLKHTQLKEQEQRTLLLHLQGSLMRNLSKTTDITECMQALVCHAKEKNPLLAKHMEKQPWMRIILKQKLHGLSEESPLSDATDLLYFISCQEHKNSFLVKIMAEVSKHFQSHLASEELMNKLCNGPYRSIFPST